MPLAQRILSSTGVLLYILAVFGIQSVHAAGKPPPAGLAIESASWNGATLTASGTAVSGKDGGSDVTIYDAATNTSLGSTTPSRGGAGNWNFSGNTCAQDINARQDGTTTANFHVTDSCAPPQPQCSDGLDNDGDGLIDFPDDPGCTDASDNDETDAQPLAQCEDGIDNDGDGLIDFPADPGCTDANDNDETDAPQVPECNDGLDNDGDGLIDYPADPGCTDANDYREIDLPAIDPQLNPQTDFKIMMNYELGMHCTGFEFAYCCVLPVYNSILAQVVKPNTIDPNHSGDYARLMKGDPNEGLDALGRETVVRDLELDNSGNFKKYVLKYWHEAQPRNDGRGKEQSSLLISAAEGNSLQAWNTRFDSATTVGGALQYDGYNGADGVVQGNGDFDDPSDNYQNAVWNHLYFYENLEGDNSTGTSQEEDKIRLGVTATWFILKTVVQPCIHWVRTQRVVNLSRKVQPSQLTTVVASLTVTC